MNDEAQKNSGGKHQGGTASSPGGRFRPLDFIVILFCLSGAVYSVILFRLDLSKNEKPVGTVIIGNNVVQRRMANRVLWDRLGSDSPVFSGDQIRTADHSDATLYIERNSIDLNGKTLIRIQRSPEDEDSILIYLDEGNLVLTTVDGGGNIELNLMGRQVETAPGTILSASVGKEGAIVQVSEGTATLTGDGQRREISPGTMVALNSSGTEQVLKAAVVLHPRPDARYLKYGPEPLFINFAWNRINLEPEDALCLEIAEDRNFKRIVQVFENLDTATWAAFNVGLWYWRLSLPDPGLILSTGQLTMTDASGPALLSPVTDSLFRYQNKLPVLRFQWSKIAGALSYILEASETPDFISPRLKTQTSSLFLIDSSLGSGTWYWRVMPVFPPVYEGKAAFSTVSFFHIKQGDTAEQVPGAFVPMLPEPVIEQPEPMVELPEPLNRLPPTGHRIGIEQFRESNSIVFTWSEVQGANAYMFTLYQETANGRRQIIRVPPGTRRNWTLENLAALDRGTFIWQVEAVMLNSAGIIENRGRIGENSFVIDIPRPGQVQIEDSETIYDN